MGIVNLTPDSFSGDGVGASQDAALRHAEKLLADGADMLDLGGESSRPGAPEVSVQEELDRVMPVLESLLMCGVPISIDTCKPEVMREALRLGADIINDIRGLQTADALDALAKSRAGVCIMHMQGEPRTMQNAPAYQNVAQEVAQFLVAQAQRAEQAGVAANRILLDPGFGFGKTLQHNLTLLRQLPELVGEGYAVLVGLSRKSMLGTITGRTNPSDRVSASVAAALLAVQCGANIVRVHDVAATKDALSVWNAVIGQNP